MRIGPLVTSLLGAFGGRALGGALGGNTGRMIGSLAGSMLGGKMGQGAGRGGGLGGLLGGLMGGGKGGAGGMLGGMLGGGKSDEPRRLADAEAVDDLDDEHGLILISAMCSAAKSDGTVDQAEIDLITGRLGDLDADEKAFLQRELSGPVDVAALAARVPKGFEPEVYAASLLAVDSVNGAESAYLAQLASAMKLSAEDVQSITSAITGNN
jgi:uncharacterized membrane protein YebE (DUF533 family)